MRERERESCVTMHWMPTTNTIHCCSIKLTYVWFVFDASIDSANTPLQVNACAHVREKKEWEWKRYFFTVRVPCKTHRIPHTMQKGNSRDTNRHPTDTQPVSYQTCDYARDIDSVSMLRKDTYAQLTRTNDACTSVKRNWERRNKECHSTTFSIGCLRGDM